MVSPKPQGRQYRSRIESPCDGCRQRRVCCIRDGGETECSLCRRRGIPCVYRSKPQPKKRKKKSVDEPTDGPATANATAPPTAALLSPASASLPAVTSPASSTSGPTQAAQYLGLSGDQDPFVLQHGGWHRSERDGDVEWNYRRVGVSGNVMEPVQFMWFKGLGLGDSAKAQLLRQIEQIVHPNSDSLIKAFFDTVHWSFPLLDPLDRSGLDKSPSLRAVVYSLALPYCAQAKNVNQDLLEEILSGTLPIEARAPTLETVEAALLHAQRNPHVFSGTTTPVWAEVGSLVGMSQDMGLNVNPDGWDISDGEKSRRKRLWWAVYMQDKWAALSLGRPSYLHNDQFTVSMLTLADLQSERVSALMFIAMATLTVTLSDLLSTFYTLKALQALRSVSKEHIQGLLDQFEEKIDVWQSEVMEPAMANRGFPDGTGTLELAYYTVKVILYRAVLPKLLRRDDPARDIQQRASATSEQAIALVETLQISRLSAFWWSMSRINLAMVGSFMLSMLLSSASEEQSDYWMNQIVVYQGLLQAHSVNINLTRLASVRLGLLTKDSRLNHAHSSSATGNETNPRTSNLFPGISSQSLADLSLVNSASFAENDFVQWCTNIEQPYLGNSE